MHPSWRIAEYTVQAQKNKWWWTIKLIINQICYILESLVKNGTKTENFVF